tara:strand:- start:1481 stop:1909 length:429 start_codon:yes stop_codon:yes gene_type:complete
MSTLKTDTIVGAGGNNEVTFVNNKFTGSASGSITLPAEGGTVTTNLQQGLCKSWSYYETASTFVNNDSFNVSSLTDRGTGDCRLVFTNAFSSVNRPQHGMSGSRHFSDGDSSASFANFVSADGSNNQEDGARSSGMVSGDLA